MTGAQAPPMNQPQAPHSNQAQPLDHRSPTYRLYQQSPTFPQRFNPN